jgi:predicted house-cleaning noncanonical NTP pyrophosphatase (MazG superfamily)
MALTPAPDGYPIKLVRDNTPDLINQSGEPGELWYEISTNVGEEELMRLLKLKLAEEVGEYLVDGGRNELADVLAVVDGLSRLHGTGLSDILEIVHSDPRGMFPDGVVMFGRHPEFDGGDG